MSRMQRFLKLKQCPEKKNLNASYPVIREGWVVQRMKVTGSREKA